MSFGRFERQGAPLPMSDINMTPLVDVMLVLVVILLVTAPLLASAIRVDLPRAHTRADAAGAASVVLTIDRYGALYLDDVSLTAEGLAAALRATAQRRADTEVRVRADARLPYARLAQVMGLVQQSGLQRLGFMALEPET